jgi:hypothetical protein
MWHRGSLARVIVTRGRAIARSKQVIEKGSEMDHCLPQLFGVGLSSLGPQRN